MSIRVIDKGWKRIKAQLKEISGAYVGVGLFASKVKETSKSTSKPLKDLNIAQVGAINEWGLPSKNIPSRPFLRLAYEKNRNILNTLKASFLKKIYSGQLNYDKALEKLGLQHVGQIQKTITDSTNFEPNAPATLAIKNKKTRKGSEGSAKPLIDTGRMRQSITFEVKK